MYEFRAMTAADLPMIRQWLETPHVAQWWGDADEQYALVRDDLSEPAMDQFIVTTAGRPFGYLQCYRLSAWNTGFGQQPEETRCIDQFIGVADMIDRGHGSALTRVFVEGLLTTGTPRVVTGPDPMSLLVQWTNGEMKRM